MFTGLRILVLGDVMIDRYLAGRVDRISPEAPVPVLALGTEDNRLGGAANVALNLAALGATPLLAGVVGDDENGVLFRQLLADHGLNDDLIVTDPDRCTTVKTRLMAGGQQLLRVDREDTHDLKGAAAGAMLSKIAGVVEAGQVDLLLLQDYNKGVLHRETIERILGVTAGRVDSVVDPKDRYFWDYTECGLFKPNLREIQQQVDFPVEPTLPSLDRAAGHIFERLGCAAVMITLSEHGIYVHDGSTSAIHPTSARTVRDVSGAGDTVIAVAACGWATGMPLHDIAALANRAGAQVIAKSGVVAIDAEALFAEQP